MRPRLLSFLKSAPDLRSNRRAQWRALAGALDGASSALEQVSDWAANVQDDPTPVDWDNFSRPLIAAVKFLTTPRAGHMADKDLVVTPDTLAAQIIDIDIDASHRAVIYEIAIVMAEDLRNELLRTLRDISINPGVDATSCSAS